VAISTWLFFVVFAGVAVVMWIVASRTPKNIHPVEIDGSWRSIAAFYRGRPDRSTEVELGNGWRSATDPGAAFEVSWIKATNELVALRHQAHPDLMMGLGLVSAMPAGINARATGMKVLAVVDLRTLHRVHPYRLELLEDGLDQLTEAIGAPYRPPHPEDPHWSSDRTSN
jgi:hypothetical protein